MNQALAIIAGIAYLLGSIPFGYILVRVFRGGDVRRTGSGNIGATNVARSAPGLGVLTLLLDAAKAFTAVAVAAAICAAPAGSAGFYSVVGVAAFFAVVGHIFPVWLRFQGGKGVATGVGAFVAIVPKAILLALVVFAVLFAGFRYVSLASIAAAATLPLFVYVLYVRPGLPMVSVLAAAVAASLLIIARHNQNISRLLAHTEHRFYLKRG